MYRAGALRHSDNGASQAQFALAEIYASGAADVPKDLAKAAVLYAKAAEQGHPGARVNLAVMYSSAVGVPKDLVKAYMWADLAAASGEPNGAKLRESLKTMMNSDEIVAAQRASREWRPEKY